MASNVGSRAFQNARLQKKLKEQAETLLPAALSAYREGRQTDAQVLCRQLLADLPDFFDMLQLLGVLLVECGRFAEGVPYLERAVALDPRPADAHCNLGFTLFNLERYAEARVLLEKAVMLQPNCPTAQRNLANTLLRLELAEPAIAAFTRVIELNPSDSDAWCNRGVAELMLKRWDAAALSSERALGLQPGHFRGDRQQWPRASGTAPLRGGGSGLQYGARDATRQCRGSGPSRPPADADGTARRGRGGFRCRGGARSYPRSGLAGQGADLHADRQRRAGDARLQACAGAQPDRRGCADLARCCLGRRGDTAGAIAHFDRALAITPDYDEAISKKIF
jgi:tetratricopeptide (TPR) repeat protein